MLSLGYGRYFFRMLPPEGLCDEEDLEKEGLDECDEKDREPEEKLGEERENEGLLLREEKDDRGAAKTDREEDPEEEYESKKLLRREEEGEDRKPEKLSRDGPA